MSAETAAPPPIPRIRARLRAYAAGVDAATPAGRDRAADVLRAGAIGGVVLGHWLVTAWDFTAEGHLVMSSPLAYLPDLAPVSWVLQTLAVFFFVGGHVSARSLLTLHADTRAWLGGRMVRLLRPAVPLLLFWAVLATALTAADMPWRSLRSLMLPALGPLWFLAVFAALTALTPLLLRLPPFAVPAAMAGVVLAVDLVRPSPGGPTSLGWVNVLAAWLVPYGLGVAFARGRLRGRAAAWGLLLGGAAGMAVLLVGFGYPASMVGVTGARVSNLSPPTLAAVCFGAAQVGVALLARERLARLARGPGLWAVVVVINLSAMALFLWHQTALVLVALAAMPFGAVPGLLAPPADAGWIAGRVGWMLLLAVAALVAVVVASVARLKFHDRVSPSS
ncbi:hypothetical protein SAMN05421505_11959 [Sinosporangium album]|uniref:Acyltransferase 3 domain-containing protein n=1 Tax=Sinosporangium album TaxID=504805 RepID=A0A1G8DZG3_9ACTN|nr:acyltransferase [Sinosporangium album]SDH63136.1 hypothetical protein SAMN05421505_11959 [Sinosporangium album]